MVIGDLGMNTISRPTALKIAAVLSFLLSAFGVVFSLPLIAQGAASVDSGAAAPPYFILVLGLVLGVIGIVAAYGAPAGNRLKTVHHLGHNITVSQRVVYFGQPVPHLQKGVG
jgi:hypothetical protein